jgi:hypothetical protein
VATFSNQIRNDPMFLAQLNRVHREAKQLRSPKSTSDKEQKHRVIPLSTQRVRAGSVEQPFPLLGGKPIANPYAQPTHALDAANASGQFRTQQTGVRCFVRNSSDSREAQINR